MNNENINLSFSLMLVEREKILVNSSNNYDAFFYL